MNLSRLQRTSAFKKTFDVEQVKDLIYATYGKVLLVAKALDCCPATFYAWIDTDHPELKEDIDKARRYGSHIRVDASEYVQETVADLVATDPALALRSAHYTLRRERVAKERGWITDDKEAKDADSIDSIDIAEIASELQREAAPRE